MATKPGQVPCHVTSPRNPWRVIRKMLVMRIQPRGLLQPPGLERQRHLADRQEHEAEDEDLHDGQRLAGCGTCRRTPARARRTARATPTAADVEAHARPARHRACRRPSRRRNSEHQRGGDHRAERRVPEWARASRSARRHGASSSRSKNPLSMSVAVPPAAPMPANDDALQDRVRRHPVDDVAVGNPSTLASALNEPENATTKNIGMMIAGMINAGSRRMRIMPRAVSERNTAKSRAPRAHAMAGGERGFGHHRRRNRAAQRHEGEVRW